MARRFAVLLVLVLGCDRGAPAPSRSAPSTTREAPRAPVPAPAAPRLKPAGDLVYFERVTGGADPAERLPLVIAIHGLGDDPESFASLFDGFTPRARIAIPRAPEPHGGGFSWFAYRPGMSEDELARGITKAIGQLSRAIDDVARDRPTRGKPVVTGFSQGGMLSFALAVRHPSLLSAAIPVGGTLPEPLWPAAAWDAARAPRIVALHGVDDRVVPLAPTERAVKALETRGVAVELVRFDGVGHSIPPPVRERLFAALAEALR